MVRDAVRQVCRAHFAALYQRCAQTICRAMAAARPLVGHFKKGHKAKTGLKQKQEQQNVPQPHYQNNEKQAGQRN